MKRPTISPRRRWRPSRPPKQTFGFRDVVAIAAVATLVAVALGFYVTHPPPLRLTGSSLGPDWDCAPEPYATACVKRIGPGEMSHSSIDSDVRNWAAKHSLSVSCGWAGRQLWGAY